MLLSVQGHNMKNIYLFGFYFLPFFIWTLLPFFYFSDFIGDLLFIYVLLILPILIFFSFCFYSNKYQNHNLIYYKKISRNNFITLLIIFSLISFLLFYFKNFVNFDTYSRFNIYVLTGFLSCFYLYIVVRIKSTLTFTIVTLIFSLCYMYNTTRIVWLIVSFVIALSYRFPERKKISFLSIKFVFASFLCLVFILLVNFWKRAAIGMPIDDFYNLFFDLSNAETLEHTSNLFLNGKDHLFWGQGFLSGLIFPWILDPSTFKGTGKLALIFLSEDFSNNPNRSLSIPFYYEMILNFGIIWAFLVFSFFSAFLFSLSKRPFNVFNMFLLISFFSFWIYLGRGDFVFAFVPSFGFLIGGILFLIFFRRFNVN